MLNTSTKLGITIAAAGVAVVLVALTVWAPRVHDALMISGGLVAVGGGIVVATSLVLDRQRATQKPVEDAYEEGHDLGYSKGWRECARENVRPASNLRPKHRAS